MQKYVLLKESDQLTPQIILVYTDTRVVSLTSLCGVKSDEAERFQAQLDFVRIKNVVVGASLHVAGPGEASCLCAKTGDLRALSGAPRRARWHRPPNSEAPVCCDSKQWGQTVACKPFLSSP
jgi:hypothetical protein